MTITNPNFTGFEDNQEYFGDSENPVAATHRWDMDTKAWFAKVAGAKHVPMSDAFEDAIPGAEAIPADMPNAPHGDIPLPYDLQTFNSLVAANTAMTGEISSLEEKIGMLLATGTRDRETIASHEENVAHLHEMRKEDRETIKVLNTTIANQSATIRNQEKGIAEQAANHRYENDRSNTLNLQLERMKGYLDRTLEQEEPAIAAPQEYISPPRGPRIGEISIPENGEENTLSRARQTLNRAIERARHRSRTF